MSAYAGYSGGAARSHQIGRVAPKSGPGSQIVARSSKEIPTARAIADRRDERNIVAFGERQVETVVHADPHVITISKARELEIAGE